MQAGPLLCPFFIFLHIQPRKSTLWLFRRNSTGAEPRFIQCIRCLAPRIRASVPFSTDGRRSLHVHQANFNYGCVIAVSSYDWFLIATTAKAFYPFFFVAEWSKMVNVLSKYLSEYSSCSKSPFSKQSKPWFSSGSSAMKLNFRSLLYVIPKRAINTICHYNMVNWLFCFWGIIKTFYEKLKYHRRPVIMSFLQRFIHTLSS